MFERYINKDFVSIPFSGRKIHIDQNGKIVSTEISIFIDETTKGFIENGHKIESTLDVNGEQVVHLNLWEGAKYYRVAMLVAFSFKPVNIPYTQWSKLSILFRDGDKSNIHPSNLVWSWEPGLECSKYPGYAFIPGYTRYVINRAGDLINHQTGSARNQYQYDNGYVIFSTLRPDLGQRVTIGRHRMLCLAWKPYPANVDELHVNHIDGVPGNDSLENLEFVTSKQNLYHALRNGLKIGNAIESVFVKNAKSGTIKEYGSCEECANDLSLKALAVHYRCRKQDQAIWPGYLQFQFGYELQSWRIPDDIEAEHSYSIHRDAVICRNVLTGEIIEFPTATDCSKHFGYNELTISVRLRDKTQKVYSDGYQFQRIAEYTDWRFVKDPVKEINEAQLTVKTFVRDIFTKEEWCFDSIAETCENLKVPVHVVMDRKTIRKTIPGFL